MSSYFPENPQRHPQGGAHRGQSAKQLHISRRKGPALPSERLVKCTGPKCPSLCYWIQQGFPILPAYKCPSRSRVLHSISILHSYYKVLPTEKQKNNSAWAHSERHWNDGDQPKRISNQNKAKYFSWRIIKLPQWHIYSLDARTHLAEIDAIMSHLHPAITPLYQA